MTVKLLKSRLEFHTSKILHAILYFCFVLVYFILISKYYVKKCVCKKREKSVSQSFNHIFNAPKLLTGQHVKK